MQGKGKVFAAAVMIAVALVALAAADLQVTGKVGDVLIGSLEGDTGAIYWTFTVESGATYDIFVVDGYNKVYNKDIALEKPSKAVVFWLLKGDNTLYDKKVYKATEKDSKSGYGFCGVTPERSGPAATIVAEGTTLVIRVERYKSSYNGQVAVKVVKK